MTADELMERLVEIDRPELPIVVRVVGHWDHVHPLIDAVVDERGCVKILCSPEKVAVSDGFG
ncbi:MAG: hypothetical protein H0U46_11870 [Actinobacteria bacterium]|nr:hypothetical protein [Actinomycetota bacterium]